ncbi:MAG: hypothetical protein ACTHW1_02945 [Ancrocorticia sp.]|uniref:hypothetical protein n=1 Tax=Ancrocorticia sp. TaxID=2593684 RepID=UPI003F9284E3
MEFDPLWLIAAFGGGAFGAAIGGQTAFIMTGIMYMVGLAGYMGGFDAGVFMDSVVFGPVFGPHIAFAGGAAAAAYAARRNYLPAGMNGRDIVTPLAGFSKADIYVVGGIFGMIGYTLNQIVAMLPIFKVSDPAMNYGATDLGSTDTVACTIIIIAICVRFLWGSTGLFSTKEGPLFWVGGDKHWVAHQEKWSHTALIGFFSGLLSGFATLMLVLYIFPINPGIVNHAQLVGWAISAITLIFLTCGLNTPVTHHMTIIASIAALKFAPTFAGADPGSWTSNDLIIPLLLAGLFGLIAGLVGEALSRSTNANGDTHIDPPAFAIFPMTTVLYAITAIIA